MGWGGVGGGVLHEKDGRGGALHEDDGGGGGVVLHEEDFLGGERILDEVVSEDGGEDELFMRIRAVGVVGEEALYMRIMVGWWGRRVSS